MTLVDLAIGGLATWRLSHMLIYENGPWSVFRKAREGIGVKYDEFGIVTSYKYEISTCVWCLSMWVGAGVALVVWLGGPLGWLLVPFALSALSCLAETAWSRGQVRG